MTWTGPQFLSAFKAALVADAVIVARNPAVKVLTYWPAPEDRSTDAVLLYRIRPGRLESAAIGDENRSKDDYYTVESQVEVLRPGAGEAVATEAAEAVTTIFDRVMKVANDRPAVGNQTLAVTVGDMDFAQFPTTVGKETPTPVRVAVLAFGIEVRSRVSIPAS